MMTGALLRIRTRRGEPLSNTLFHLKLERNDGNGIDPHGVGAGLVSAPMKMVCNVYTLWNTMRYLGRTQDPPLRHADQNPQNCKNMKSIIEKIVEVAAVVLPFLKKKSVKEIREFSELITAQFEFLVNQQEKALKDYFELSDRVKEMHTEIFSLRQELTRAMAQRCSVQECIDRT